MAWSEQRRGELRHFPLSLTAWDALGTKLAVLGGYPCTHPTVLSSHGCLDESKMTASVGFFFSLNVPVLMSLNILASLGHAIGFAAQAVQEDG